MFFVTNTDLFHLDALLSVFLFYKLIRLYHVTITSAYNVTNNCIYYFL